MTQTRGD